MQTHNFSIPERDAWIRRVKEYVFIPEFPIDLSLIVVEYASSFTLTLREPCKRCDGIKNPGHPIYTSPLGLDDVHPYINNDLIKPEPELRAHIRVLLSCITQSSGTNQDVIFDLLSDQTWHRRLKSVIPIHPKNVKTKANPNGVPFRDSMIPRDSYIIRDFAENKIIKSELENCIEPVIFEYNSTLAAIDTLVFRDDIF